MFGLRSCIFAMLAIAVVAVSGLAGCADAVTMTTTAIATPPLPPMPRECIAADREKFPEPKVKVGNKTPQTAVDKGFEAGKKADGINEARERLCQANIAPQFAPVAASPPKPEPEPVAAPIAPTATKKAAKVSAAKAIPPIIVPHKDGT